MNLKVIIYLISTLPTWAWAQKIVNIPIDKEHVVLDFVSLQEQGFLIKTGIREYHTTDVDWHLRYYTSGLQEVWSVPLEAKDEKSFRQQIIATSSGSYVYHLERRGVIRSGNVGSIQLTQITKDGAKRAYAYDEDSFGEAEGKEELLFCDSSHLYLVLMNEGSKRTPPQVILNRISHDNLSFSQQVIALPYIAKDKSIYPWEYVGHGDQHIWFASRAASRKTGSHQCQLVAVDWQGNVGRPVTINSQVGKHLRVSLNRKSCPGAVINRITSKKNTYSSQTSSSSPIILRADGLAGIQVDDNNEIIYIYGFYGKDPQNNRRSHSAGFHLTAYDTQGNQRWQHLSTDQDAIVTDGIITERLHDTQRGSIVEISKQGTLRLQLRLPYRLYTYHFTKDGRIAKAFQDPFVSPYSVVSSTVAPYNSLAREYCEENASHKKIFYGFTTDKTHVLVEDFQGKELNLLKW